MKALLAIILAAASLFTSLPSSAQKPQPATVAAPFAQRLYNATALLYQREAKGGLNFRCTATNFLKTDVGYYAVTAKHCVHSDEKYFLVFDEDSDRPYIKADVLFTTDDTDVAVLGYFSKENLPVIPLGDEKLESIGSPVVNVSSPLGLGKLYFDGHIAAMTLRDRVQADGVPDPMVLQLPAAGGASGSAVCSPAQEAIIGIVVMIYIPDNGGSIATTAVPVSQVKRALVEYVKESKETK